MSTRSLATVEWQLIMHCCEAADLLALARCSRSILAAASNPFAWQGCSAVPLRFHEDQLNLSSRISSSLLRFAPSFAIQWVEPYQGADLSESELDALASLPRVVSLDARGWRNKYSYGDWNMDSHHWRRIFSFSNMRSLTALFVGHSSGECCLDSACMDLLADNCPDLRTLSITHDNRMQRGTYSSGALTRMHCLTDLSINGSGEGRMFGVESVATCTGLTRLHLRSCDSAAVNIVLQSPNMRGLQHLTLDNVRCGPPSTIDWPTCAAALPCLQSLALRQCGNVEDVLAAALHCLALISLHISPAQVQLHPGFPLAFSPEPATLSRLLQLQSAATESAQPQLRTLVVRLTSEQRVGHGDEYRRQLTLLQKKNSDRMTLVL